jgi:hypothetical protein
VREIAFRSDTTAGDRDVTANIIQIFLDGQISANNGTATDKPNIPLIGAAEIQPDGDRDPLGEDRVIGACI